MNSLNVLIPEWVGSMDEQIQIMLGEFPSARRHESVLEVAPRELLECMVLHRLCKDAGHQKGLTKEERKERELILAAVVPLKAWLLSGLSKKYPDIRKGINCTHVRSDGRIWSHPIRLP